MVTGLQAYDALKQRTAAHGIGSNVSVLRADALDLRKLTVNDLLARDYDQVVAEQVVDDMVRNDSIARLGKSMGLILVEV